MNRFEKHPVLTAVVLLGVLVTGLLFLAEQVLRPSDPEARKLPYKRHLIMREWEPHSTRTYRTPEARYNDPNGPVDDSYTIDIDAHGFIKPSVRHERPDFEIVFLGGSTTECLYLRADERFPAHTGRLLEARTGKKINTINAGRSGNNSMHSLLTTVGKVLPRRPRYAVLMHATNDIGWLSNYGGYWHAKKDIGLVQPNRRGLSHIGRNLRDMTFPYTFSALSKGLKVLRLRVGEALSPRREPAAPDAKGQAEARTGAVAPAAPPNEKEQARRKVLRENYEPALRSFVRLAKAWGVRPVLMTQVLVRKGVGTAAAQGDLLNAEALARGDFDAAGFSSTHAFANALIAYVAKSEGALLIDLAGGQKWAAGDVYDGLHLTPTGAARVSELIAQAIAADLEAPDVSRETP